MEKIPSFSIYGCFNLNGIFYEFVAISISTYVEPDFKSFNV